MSKHRPNRSDPPRADSHAALSLEDTGSQKICGVTARVKSGHSGYNPYDAVPSNPGADEARKPTDLRKLSEWIRLTRQVEALKKNKPG